MNIWEIREAIAESGKLKVSEVKAPNVPQIYLGFLFNIY